MLVIRPNDISIVTCDICEQVILPEHAKFIRIYANSRMSSTNKVIHTVDICPVCYDRLRDILQIER